MNFYNRRQSHTVTTAKECNVLGLPEQWVEEQLQHLTSEQSEKLIHWLENNLPPPPSNVRNYNDSWKFDCKINYPSFQF